MLCCVTAPANSSDTVIRASDSASQCCPESTSARCAVSPSQHIADTAVIKCKPETLPLHAFIISNCFGCRLQHTLSDADNLCCNGGQFSQDCKCVVTLIMLKVSAACAGKG